MTAADVALGSCKRRVEVSRLTVASPPDFSRLTVGERTTTAGTQMHNRVSEPLAHSPAPSELATGGLYGETAATGPSASGIRVFCLVLTKRAVMCTVHAGGSEDTHKGCREAA